MGKKKIYKIAIAVVILITGIIIVTLIVWNSFDSSKSIQTWISGLDIEDTSTKVFCNKYELPKEEKAKFINILKELPAKKLSKSNTCDETTPNYFFDVTDGETTYTVVDQISKGGKAFIYRKGSRGKGWYIKDNQIREFMDKIYENDLKQKDRQ
ncbi:MAG: hypothetical protein HFI34_04385 [Lachnospiraceae bacterium]|nr:hypothetical protein [Lachnospiraceae bacterium]